MSDSRYENYLLSDIEYWQLPYIGRTVNEKYALLFDHNGYYPSDDYDNHPEYSEKDIIINLKLQLSNDVIQSISYYKVVDHGIYSRHSDDRPLNSHDIKVFKEVLDACTVSSAQTVLNKLIEMPLKDGWIVKRVSEKTIQLSNNGNTVSLPTDYAKQIIDIAPKVPDIISNDDFWEINSGWLRGKYKEAIFALLCNFNKENFPKISFVATARERIDRENQEEAAKKALIHAIQHSQTNKVSELIEEIPEIPREAIDVAIKKGKTDYLMAFVPKTDPFWIEHIGNYAISRGETELLEQVVEKSGTNNNRLIYTAYKEHRIDYVILLLNKGYTLHIRPDNKTKYDVEELLPLTDYSEVYFSADLLEGFYNAYGSEIIEKIIDRYNNGYLRDETDAFVLWLINKHDVELIDRAAKKGVKTWVDDAGKLEKLAIQTFNEDRDYWNHVKELFIGNISLYRCITEKNLALLEYYIEREKADIHDIEHALSEKVDADILRLLVMNLDITVDENLKKVTDPYWFIGLRIDDLETFKLFFTKYSSKLQDDKMRTALYNYFVWNSYSVAKAEALVEACGFPDQLIKDVELASVLNQRLVLKLISDEWPRKEYWFRGVQPEKVIFKYYDDHTWEVIGKPASNEWDTQSVEGLHYLASLVNGECVLTNLTEWHR